MREPDITGPGGGVRFGTDPIDEDTGKPHEWRAWKARPTAAQLAQWTTSLDSWLLHAPGAHPFWSWYLVTGCVLRDVDGYPPAKIVVPGASHEFMIWSRNPEVDEPDLDDLETWGGPRLMSPPDMVQQVVGLDDERANELLFLLVRGLCTGASPGPDQDFRSWNSQLVRGTAEHLAAGKHVPS